MPAASADWNSSQPREFPVVKTGDGDRVFRDMLKQGVIVRAMSGYKLPAWIRISIGTAAQNERCLEVLDAVL